MLLKIITNTLEKVLFSHDKNKQRIIIYAALGKTDLPLKKKNKTK